VRFDAKVFGWNKRSGNAFRQIASQGITTMSTRAWLTALVSLMVNAVLFGIGVLIVINVPAFNREAAMMLPVAVLASFAITPVITGYIAPRLWFNRDDWHHG
jgi:hypothetical protein